MANVYKIEAGIGAAQKRTLAARHNFAINYIKDPT